MTVTDGAPAVAKASGSADAPASASTSASSPPEAAESKEGKSGKKPKKQKAPAVVVTSQFKANRKMTVVAGLDKYGLSRLSHLPLFFPLIAYSRGGLEKGLQGLFEQVRLWMYCPKVPVAGHGDLDPRRRLGRHRRVHPRNVSSGLQQQDSIAS